jgi:hypothetical protein
LREARGRWCYPTCRATIRGGGVLHSLCRTWAVRPRTSASSIIGVMLRDHIAMGPTRSTLANRGPGTCQSWGCPAMGVTRRWSLLMGSLSVGWRTSSTSASREIGSRRTTVRTGRRAAHESVRRPRSLPPVAVFDDEAITGGQRKSRWPLSISRDLRTVPSLSVSRQVSVWRPLDGWLLSARQSA